MRLSRIMALESGAKRLPNINYGGFFSDGRVIVYIDGKRYEYVTPAFYHDKWKRMAAKAPFKVLNLIKKSAQS